MDDSFDNEGAIVSFKVPELSSCVAVEQREYLRHSAACDDVFVEGNPGHIDDILSLCFIPMTPKPLATNEQPWRDIRRGAYASPRD